VRVYISIFYRVLFALAGLAVVVINALIERKIVDWNPLIAVYVASAVGAIAVADNLAQLKFKYDAQERNAARSRMHKPVISGLVSITKARPVDFEQLGVSVFGIRREWVRKYKVVPLYLERLHRSLRFRLSDYPSESPVSWTKDKGAIGECWEKGIAVRHDRRAAAAAFGDPSVATEAMFATLTPEQRSGFTFAEFVETIEKYGEILAVPVRAKHSGELIGILSIDCVADAYAGHGAPTILEGDDIKVFARRAANLIRDDVGKF
jgi:hypothetical protein